MSDGGKGRVLDRNLKSLKGDRWGRLKGAGTGKITALTAVAGLHRRKTKRRVGGKKRRIGKLERKSFWRSKTKDHPDGQLIRNLMQASEHICRLAEKTVKTEEKERTGVSAGRRVILLRRKAKVRTRKVIVGRLANACERFWSRRGHDREALGRGRSIGSLRRGFLLT